MGTVAVNEVVVAAVTVAFVAPKNTMLLAGVLLKLVPVMVATVTPDIPTIGFTDVIVGCANTLAAQKNKANVNSAFFMIIFMFVLRKNIVFRDNLEINDIRNIPAFSKNVLNDHYL
jgi:hypothetical protein